MYVTIVEERGAFLFTKHARAYPVDRKNTGNVKHAGSNARDVGEKKGVGIRERSILKTMVNLYNKEYWWNGVREHCKSVWKIVIYM